MARIKYPEGAVRTPEQIIEQAKADGLIVRGLVWQTCYNCAGSGDFPSSMIPAGRCRLYCWARPSSDPRAFPGTMVEKAAGDPTYGKLAYSVAQYVKREQAHDRREYRHQLGAADRERRAIEYRARETEQAAVREAARIAREAERMAEIATRRHVGAIGERVRVRVTTEGVVRMPGAGYTGGTKYLVRFRDVDSNLLILWTESLPLAIDRDGAPLPEWQTVDLVGTVKAHDSFKDEPQTVLQRVKCSAVA